MREEVQTYSHEVARLSPNTVRLIKRKDKSHIPTDEQVTYPHVLLILRFLDLVSQPHENKSGLPLACT